MGNCIGNPNKVESGAKAQNENPDQALERLKKQNPFLAAVVILTKEKSIHVANASLNSQQMTESKLSLADCIAFNTYEPEKRKFIELLHSWAKNFYTSTEVYETLGDCRQSIWIQAIMKWAWKYLGSTNYMQKFGTHTGFDPEKPNPYDSDIEQALDIMDSKDNDHKELAWTSELEHNIRTVFYYNVESHREDFDGHLHKHIE